MTTVVEENADIDIYEAFKNCDEEIIHAALSSSEFDVSKLCSNDPRYNGYALLHFACGYCTREIIELTLKHPTCKINILNKPPPGREEMTALDFLQFNMNDDMKKDTEFLRQNYGAKTAQEVIADNINNYDDNDGNSNKDNEKEDDGREGGLAKKPRQETALLKEDSPTEE